MTLNNFMSTLFFTSTLSLCASSMEPEEGNKAPQQLNAVEQEQLNELFGQINLEEGVQPAKVIEFLRELPQEEALGAIIQSQGNPEHIEAMDHGVHYLTSASVTALEMSGHLTKEKADEIRLTILDGIQWYMRDGHPEPL
jgi:hypothetical protein